MKTIEQINEIIELGNHSCYWVNSYKKSLTQRAYCTVHFESKKGGAGETYTIGKRTFELLQFSSVKICKLLSLFTISLKLFSFYFLLSLLSITYKLK